MNYECGEDLYSAFYNDKPIEHEMEKVQEQMERKPEDIKHKEVKLMATKQIQIDHKDIDALQRLAYTEIWVKGQQSRKPSMHCKFTATLEEKIQELTLEEQAKCPINKQLLVNPTKSSTTDSDSFKTVPDKPYVSPFANLPTVPEGKKLPLQKPCIYVRFD